VLLTLLTPACTAFSPASGTTYLQVVYILDQVRALEQEMRRRLYEQGLEYITPKIMVVTRLIPQAMGTTCNERIERIHGTEHAYILRVPWRDESGRVSQLACTTTGMCYMCVELLMHQLHQLAALNWPTSCACREGMRAAG
jgi:hypothetical protein